MYCMNCGSQLDAGSKFCDKCGANVKNISGNNNQVQESAAPKTKKIPWVLVSCVAVIFGVAWVLLNTHTCDDCKKTYVGAQYYDVWNTDYLMCKECAQAYYSLVPYENYRK